KDSRLVQQILKIRPGKSRGRLSDLLQIYVVSQRLIPRVYAEDLFSSAHIRTPHDHVPVKSPRSEDRRIKDILPVRRRHHNDAFIDAEAVHLHKELVQRLFSLVVAASET